METIRLTGGGIDYTADGRTGTGVLQIEVRDTTGKLLCGSVYDVTITKEG